MKRLRTARWRAVAAAFTLLATASAFLVSAATPASAGINSGIVLTDASLSHVDQLGNPVDGRQEVWQGDHLEFSVNYDATNTTLTPGDEFTVELPAFLDLQDTAARKPLLAADGVTAGECTLSNTTINSTLACVFTDAILGKSDVRGGLKMTLQVAETTTAPSVEVGLSGKTQTVALPYGKPVAARPAEPWQVASEPSEYSEQVTSNSKGINWSILAPGAWLNEHYPAGSAVVVQDTLMAGKLVLDEYRAYNRIIEECVDPRNPQAGISRVVADGAGKSVDGFRLKVEATPQQEITLTMSGPWSSQCNYHVKLRSTFADNKTIDKSVTYENTATFVAAGTQVKTERAYLESFTGTASYQDGGKTKQTPGAEQTVASEDA